jgi:hypothetical protein
MRSAPLKHRKYLPADWTMQDSQAIQALPRGWRWLKVGEYAEPGDILCDPRAMPAKIMSGFPMTAQMHPVRRGPR